MEKAYLQKSVYCDFDHTAVSSLARDLAKDEQGPARVTEAAFKYIRDNIRFGFDLVRVKASETLSKGYGVCYNKSLLLVALLRSNKIPSRMAYYPVNREFMRPAMGEACQTLTESFNHCFTQVLLNGEWIATDATLDTATYQKLFKPFQVSWGIDWNGKEDMQLYTEHITGPVVVIEDIDTAIQKDMGNVLPPPSEADAFFGPANQQMWQAVAAGS
ncbi:MAG: transglutaminase family protein [Desulfatitalea sp.]|nr:transglutaminase family protein [Desulfatitalea sp.]NNJ99613.1 transglutaminase family protein [Desulfatitalea sp.]